MSARYAIGIDLGTTNCALSYVSLEGGDSAESVVLDLPQWQSESLQYSAATLPSFLYLPPGVGEDGESGERWVAGLWARDQALKTPGRVVQSAKSWLGAHGSDRTAKFLPWASKEVEAGDKLSPVEASALLLGSLRRAWNEAMGVEAAFDDQQITVTVPASFDAVAQKLTLDAAALAGFPVAGASGAVGNVRLLEEPQAAFYRWLESHRQESRGALLDALPGLKKKPQHVLIVDIGGGTSDFSIFEIKLEKRAQSADIKRIAVSDHILLGGDNMDLSLAYRIETRLGLAEGVKLSGDQWAHLVARCRTVKEQALASRQDKTPDKFAVSIPGRGSGLMAGKLNAEVTAEEVREWLLEGFYPLCEAQDEPQRAEAGLREWGLSYAVDSGITRHLADFLQGLPTADAVLFNGGSLQSDVVRERLLDMVRKWTGGGGIGVLENPQKDLAVARGAARYGWLSVRDQKHRIESAVAHSLYLETRSTAGEPEQLVCILPKGTAREEAVVLEGAAQGLNVRVNQPVSFRLFSSTRGGDDSVGDVVQFQRKRHRAMPALQTIIASEDRELRQLPVDLNSRLNALGLLQVDCVAGIKSWPLEFQLGRGSTDAKVAADGELGEPVVAVLPGVESDVLEDAKSDLRVRFAGAPGGRDPITPARLTKRLEEQLGLLKRDWNAALLRGLWPAVHESFAMRENSFDHEESWVGLAGLLLRPGFGVALDEARMDQLWEFHADGFWYPGKAMQVNADVLWRRVAGGLSTPRQVLLGEDAEERVRQSGKKVPAEAVRLLGALERLTPEHKTTLANLFLERTVQKLEKNEYADPFLAALSRLLNRALFVAGPESVVPAVVVERAFDQLRDFDWEKAAGGEMVTLFMRAARITDDRALDLESGLRKNILSKLKKSGVAPIRLVPLREFVPLADADRVSLFGESLPGGLVWAGGD